MRGMTATDIVEIPPVLAVELQLIGATTIVRLHGCLSNSSLSALQAQIDQLACIPPCNVEFELSGLRQLDATGVSLLAGLHHYVRALGGTMTVTGAHGDVAAALAAEGLI